MRIKAREITITVLVALICVAGYVNWNYQRQQSAAQPAAAPEATQEAQPSPTATEAAGEVQPTDDGQQPTDAFAEDKINKEKAKSESIALLKQTAESESASEEARKKAQDDILFLSGSIEKEQRAETLLKAKGFAQTNVLIAPEAVSVIVKTDGLNAADVAKIKDIAVEVSGLSADAVKIIEVKN